MQGNKFLVTMTEQSRCHRTLERVVCCQSGQTEKYQVGSKKVSRSFLFIELNEKLSKRLRTEVQRIIDNSLFSFSSSQKKSRKEKFVRSLKIWKGNSSRTSKKRGRMRSFWFSYENNCLRWSKNQRKISKLIILKVWTVDFSKVDIEKSFSSP